MSIIIISDLHELSKKNDQNIQNNYWLVDLISTEINPNINYLPITHIVERETTIPTILKTFIDINFKNTCSNYFLWVQKTFLGESHLCKNLILENFGESRTHLGEMQGSLNLYVLTGYIGYTMYCKLSFKICMQKNPQYLL